MKPLSWYRVASGAGEISFTVNDLAIVEVNGHKLTLARFHDQLYAFAYKCPHAAAILAHGYVDVKGNVVCPLHQYRYNCANGRNVSGEGYRLKTWPLEIREDGIWVGLDENYFADLFL
jgi:nitrite reductase/ring-hydroxylating ferredoxin subunit